jgi:hypothetical protein
MHPAYLVVVSWLVVASTAPGSPATPAERQGVTAPAGTSPQPPARPVAETSTSARPLDLKELEQRLRSTKAIGVFTKLTLKNQIDDLLDRFEDYYAGKSKQSIKDLRRSYDLLLMKVLSLLQDDDPPLASAILASRETIWALLADPKIFATLRA